MEEITEYSTYEEFKQRLDANISSQAEHFVEAGYLLKIARDTNILEGGGYKTVAEFAQKEYGFSKDIVSRYIAINDRFSENNYSDKLSDKYKGYGFSKLAEMLTLPDAVLEEINTNLSRNQIQEIKKEIREEEKISDIEVLCEPKENQGISTQNILEEVFHQWVKDNKGFFESLKAADRNNEVLDIIAPTGSGMLMGRISGKGKYMISIKGVEEPVTVMNLRSNEKETFQMSDISAFITREYKERSLDEVLPEEKKEEVAPVQQNESEKKEEKVTSAEEKSTKTDFYPDPVQMESICYSCLHNKECERKSTIATECNEYVNKAETEKTEEQRYNEEQDRIDRDTKKKLQELEENKTPEVESMVKIHQIRIAATFYDEVATGKKTFELRKNDREYKVGDKLEMMEIKEARFTGRIIKADITYMLEEYKGLEEGYCILGIEVAAADE